MGKKIIRCWKFIWNDSYHRIPPFRDGVARNATHSTSLITRDAENGSGHTCYCLCFYFYGIESLPEDKKKLGTEFLNV